MAANSGLLCRDESGEAGFTIVEAVVAAGILVIAMVLTVTPLVISMRSLDRSKDVTIAESLAQARIEQVRALEFDDIGHPGSAPAGILARSETRTIEGASYLIETSVQYVGSASGLNIVPQGGDGVEGAFDIGVNYKYIEVTVTPVSGGADPVRMETFVAPPTVGGLENIAVVQVEVDRHEPYDPSLDPSPLIRITGPATYTSPDANTTQYFADVEPGDYTISLVTGDGWLIHPESVATGATDVTASVGVAAQRTVRVYQPASLQVTVLDDSTGLPIPFAQLTATDLAYGPPISNSAGDYSFDGLVPDRYSVDAVATGYSSASVEVDVPGYGGASNATTTIRMVPQLFVGVDYDFYVDYTGWSDYYVHGATVTVTHPLHGTFVGATDETGHVVIQLPASSPGYSVTATSPWGHDPASQLFATGSGPGNLSLSLSKSGPTDRFMLYNGAVGPGGFFEYQVESGGWIRLEANDGGRATFIVAQDKKALVELRSYCSMADYPGSPAASTSTSLNNKDKSWNAGTSC